MTIFALTIAGIAASWAWFWFRFRDPFHPAIFLLPQFAFLYGFMPLVLIRADPLRFAFYSGNDLLYRYHAVAIFCILAVVAGVLYATRSENSSTSRWQDLHLEAPELLYGIAVALGLAGFVAWIAVMNTAGGLVGAYGRAYGGGLADSGYVNEAQFLGLIGALFIYSLRVGRDLRPLDWACIMLCVAPTLVHAFLGARRGPAFMMAMVMIGGYLYFRRRSVALPLVVLGGLGVGLLMLFLVANREAIYIGSELESIENPLEFLERWESNEYLVGLHVMNFADRFGSYYGQRELVHLVARALPHSWWPTVYQDLPQMLGLRVNLLVNSGIDPIGIAYMAPFRPSFGSAPGYVGDMWLEFGALAFPVSFLIGCLYGAVWKAAARSNAARTSFLLLAALSPFLVMQGFDPWFFRLLIYGVPAYLAIRLFAVHRAAQAEAPARSAVVARPVGTGPLLVRGGNGGRAP